MTWRAIVKWIRLPLVILALLQIAVATGLAETRLPVAHFAASPAFTLSIDSAAEFREGLGLWPIVARVDYADDAILRGRVELADPGVVATDVRVLIETRGGLHRSDACEIGDKTTIGAEGPVVSSDPRTCYFYADLRPADLRQGITITLFDAAHHSRIGSPVAVTFRRESRYAFILWEAMLSV